MGGLAAVCGLLITGGLVAVVAGWSRPASGSRPRLRSRKGPIGRRLGIRRPVFAVGWLVVGVAAASLTGWPVLAGLVPLVGVGLPVLLGEPARPELDVLAALDRWVRALAAILPTGRSIPDALRLSARHAPELLAAPLALLIERLDNRWTVRRALCAMADELDSVDADAVIASLALAAERGGTGAQATLLALADSIQDRLKALREIETERSRPRIVVRQVSYITLAVMAGALAFGGGFFAPYGTGLGQLILAALIAAYLGSLLALRRIATARPRQRILGERG